MPFSSRLPTVANCPRRKHLHERAKNASVVLRFLSLLWLWARAPVNARRILEEHFVDFERARDYLLAEGRGSVELASLLARLWDKGAIADPYAFVSDGAAYFMVESRGICVTNSVYTYIVWVPSRMQAHLVRPGVGLRDSWHPVRDGWFIHVDE